MKKETTFKLISEDVQVIKHYLIDEIEEIEKYRDESSLRLNSILKLVFSLDDKIKKLSSNRKTKDFSTSNIRKVYTDCVESFQKTMSDYNNLTYDFKMNRYPRSIYKLEQKRLKKDIIAKSEILKTLKRDIKESQKQYELLTHPNQNNKKKQHGF